MRKEASVGGWESGEMSGFKRFYPGGRQGSPWARGRDVAEDAKIDVTVSPAVIPKDGSPLSQLNLERHLQLSLSVIPDATVVVT